MVEVLIAGKSNVFMRCHGADPTDVPGRALLRDGAIVVQCLTDASD